MTTRRRRRFTADFKKRMALEDLGDELSGRRSGPLGPTDQPRRRAFGMYTLGAGHVLGTGGRLLAVAPPVRGQSLAAIEDQTSSTGCYAFARGCTWVRDDRRRNRNPGP